MDAITILTYFGLTKQEAKIYWALFSGGEMTGYEAAKETGISRSNTYTALAGLVDKGAACLMEGTATRYAPLGPEEFCENKIFEMEKLKSELLRNLPVHRKKCNGYLTISGESHILLKIRHMLVHASERVYASISSEILEKFLPELKSLTERGRKLVLITDEPFELNGATIYYAENRQDQIRLIADSTSVLTGNIGEGESSTCLYSENKNLIDLFKEALKNEIILINLTKGKGLE